MCASAHLVACSHGRADHRTWHSCSGVCTSIQLLLQVDLIVCFDSDASPIRNIQRMGRTGRHKPGRVVYIMSQGKEEDSYRKGLQVSRNPSYFDRHDSPMCYCKHSCWRHFRGAPCMVVYCMLHLLIVPAGRHYFSALSLYA